MDTESLTEKLKSAALNYLNIQPCDNPKTEILNAEFALGRFTAITMILEDINFYAFNDIVVQTKEQREKLLEIVSKIY